MNRIIFFTSQNSYIFAPKVPNNRYCNSGDFVYFAAGVSCLFGINSVQFSTYEDIESRLAKEPNYFKNNYDLAINMQANIFSLDFVSNMNYIAELIRRMKIPVFILGAGAQSTIDYSEDFLDSISESSQNFLDSIFNSGGDITLRGEFTKYCLEKLGYKDLFVSGCPSFYMSGFSDSVISNKKVGKDVFCPMFNGQSVQEINSRLYESYPESLFFDQGYYFDLLYTPELLTDERFNQLREPVKKMFVSRRIDGDMNYYLWRKRILDKKVNFSYGSRLHGNVIAIQLGIPCYINVIDSRVREIVELFNLPSNLTYHFNEVSDDLYDLYKSIDYSQFNKSYLKMFLNFEKYLNTHGIPNRLRDSHDDFINCLSQLTYFDYRKNDKLEEKVRHLSSICYCS